MSASLVPDDVRKAAAPPPAHMWRDGDCVVLHQGTFPPDRCYTCNCSQGVSREYIKLDPHRNFNFLMLLAGLAAPVTVTIHNEFSLDLAFCQKHWWLPRLMTTLCVLAFFGGIFIFFGGAIQQSVLVMVAGPLISIGGLIGFLFKPAIRLVRYVGPFVWVSGYGKPFLENLEPWPGIERFQ